MTDELREKCARAICRADDIDPNARYVHGGPMWKQRLGHADAILSIAIPAIREECARVARDVGYQGVVTNLRIEAAIRALGEKQG